MTAVIIGSVALIVLAVSLLGKDKHTVESAGESAFGAMATTESAAYERNAQTDGKTADIRKFSLTGDNAVAYAVGQFTWLIYWGDQQTAGEAWIGA